MAILTISARIKEERERLGFSQTQFAALAEASKKTQIRWEQEDGAAPDARALAKWVLVGLDALYVLTGERAGNADTSLHLAELPPDEQLVLEGYRALSAVKRKQFLSSLLRGEVGSTSSSGARISVKGSGNRTAGRDFHEKE